MTRDIPAAHSMDTTWFAVDADGHIAAFSSGEAGAVPSLVANEDDLADLALLPATEPRREELHEPTDGHVNAWQDEVTSVLYFFRDQRPLAAAVEAGRAKRLSATSGAAVFAASMPRAEHEALHSDGDCLSCRWHWEGATSMVQLGLYDYDHTTENWIAGPYERRARPSRPLRVQELPEPLKTALQKAVFTKLRFADTASIQPCKFLPSVAWGDRWLDDDGTQRSLDTGEALPDEPEWSDIPAAHSMDTTWFAVDADGVVGVFDSGEGGAVPNDAVVIELHELYLSPATEPRRAALLEPYYDGHVDPEPGTREVLYFIDDIAPFSAALADGSATRLDALHGVAVLTLFDAAVHARLHADELCRACSFRWSLEREAMAQLGVYYYDHPSQFCDVYTRGASPSRPLRVDELPPELAERIGATRFRFRFAERSSIDPRRHVLSRTWWGEADILPDPET